MNWSIAFLSALLGWTRDINGIEPCDSMNNLHMSNRNIAFGAESFSTHFGAKFSKLLK